MMDREKVIKGLEYCAASCKGAWDENNGCPYMSDFIALGPNHNGRCVDLLCADAITLLKAQEPVEPIRDINGVYYCGICNTICVGYEVEFTHSIIKVENYCHKCGRKVKWK